MRSSAVSHGSAAQGVKIGFKDLGAGGVNGNLLDLFGGVGGDFVKPFKDEDLVLGTVNGSAGLGLRWTVGASRSWIVGLDGRREWLGDRNTAGTPLGGRAWSVRLVLGVLRDEGRGARLRALQP